VLKPVCNNKRCPGKTCEGEKAGKSWYATKGGQGCWWQVWHVYDAFRAGTTVALADLVAMGVRELDGRDPTTQVLVTRGDLLKYTGRVGLCNPCTPRSPDGKAKNDNIIRKKKAGNKCNDPFGKGCTGGAGGGNAACPVCAVMKKLIKDVAKAAKAARST
tara:strand:+ start:562 stop:1041 length:480 start_codon:yes stop_codon:yes gene_type:complete